MHSRAVVVLGSLCLISLGRSALAVSFEKRPEAGVDSMPPIEDWVVFTDDLSDPYHFGCDQVSIRDDRDLSQGVLTGAFSQSPSQLGVAPSGRVIMALDEGQSGWAHVLTGDPTSKATWKTQFFQGEFTYGADVEITLDSQFALFGYDHGLAKINVDKFSRGTQEPQSVGGYLSGRRTLPNGPRPQRLPPLDGFLPGVLPASIVLAPDGHTAYVASIDAKVYQVDIDSMQIIKTPISYQPSPQAPRRRYYDTFATLSPSGRFLVIGVGLSQQLNVMDLTLRTSQLVPIPGAGIINAVKFNYAPSADGILAVHGGNSVSVLAFDENRPYQLTVAAKTNIPAKSIGLCEDLGPGCADIWRAPALAWSHNGDIVFAAIGPIAYDWAAINFRSVGSETVVRKSYFRSCEMPVSSGRQRVSVPNDIFTFNLIPTYTPIPSDTPPPTITPSATPTPSATATASLTPPRSPTPTVTPSPTVTPRPSATPIPAPLYLPLLLRERCLTEQRRVVVALVLDASLSMLEPAGDAGLPGPARTKLDAARGAALAFLDALHLDADRGDQAAVIGFNSSATLLSPLTADRPALDAALAAIAPAPQTCIVCGVDTAAAELASARHRADHAAVLILLTDGRSNPQPAAEAVARAGLAKASGIRIYTVGLGADLDEAALREMASGPEAYRHAPSAAELAGIYRGIAVDIPCPAAAFWGGR